MGLLHILKNLPDLQLLDMKALKYITSYGFRILKELSTTLQYVKKVAREVGVREKEISEK